MSNTELKIIHSCKKICRQVRKEKAFLPLRYRILALFMKQTKYKLYEKKTHINVFFFYTKALKHFL